MSARTVLIVILLLNWLVAGAKLIAGHLVGSLALWADGFHSLLDGFSNIIGIVSLSIAVQPADEGHPYGHRKFETFATLGVSFLVLVTAFEVLRDAIQALWQGRTIVGSTGPGFAVALGTLVVNLFVVWWERREARRLGSPFLEADAAHTFSDVLVTTGVLASLALASMGLGWLDSWIALGIAVFIAHVGFSLLSRTLPVLVDAEALPTGALEEEVLGVEGIVSCHKIRSRGPTGGIYVDLHIQVDPTMPVEEAHGLSHKAKDRIMNRWEGIRDVVIHIEPAHEQS